MLNNVYLAPGTLYVARAPCVITTLVESCVAVTMWSPRRKVGGMTHYLLPRQTMGESSPRYGETALALLLARMEIFGCVASECETRVYGGAGSGLGEQNVVTAREFARARLLRIVDEQAGGRVSRRLLLDIETGGVDVMPLGG